MQPAVRSTDAAAAVTAPRAGEDLALRAVRPSDAARMHAFLLELSLRSLQQRFWSGGPNLLRLTRELTSPDAQRDGLVACRRSGEVVAHAEYVVLEPGLAEVAVVVADCYQGCGLGGRLLERLTSGAAETGLTRFAAIVHPQNGAMLHLFSRRFGASLRQFGDEIHVAFERSLPGLRDAA